MSSDFFRLDISAPRMESSTPPGTSSISSKLAQLSGLPNECRLMLH
jgi:hypothetical protein